MLGKSLLTVTSAVLCLWVTGCSVSTQVTLLQRPAIEQELLVRSLERAVAQLDIEQFTDRRVALDLFAQTEDQAFAKAFVTARLQQQGVWVVPDKAEADLRLKVFAAVLGVGRGETLVGIPSLVTPVVGAPLPELALYKSVRNRGYTELQAYAFDGQTGRFVGKTPVGIGQAKHNQYKFLIFVSFTISDLKKRLD